MAAGVARDRPRAVGDVWEYVLNSAVWSVGGLVIGYFLGRMERDIRDIKKKVEENDDDS